MEFKPKVNIGNESECVLSRRSWLGMGWEWR